MRVLEVKGRKRRLRNAGIVAAMRRMATESRSWKGEIFRLDGSGEMSIELR